MKNDTSLRRFPARARAAVAARLGPGMPAMRRSAGRERADFLPRGTSLLQGFDVFDTLITRCWWRPEDLFLRVGECLAEAGLTAEPPEAFAARRVAAEAALRAMPGVEEVTIAEIYAALAPDNAAAAAAIEQAVELEAIRPIAANAARLAACDRAVLISDTYLDAATVTGLLHRAGIMVPAAQVFASSDVRATKRSGRLFRHVADRLGVKPGQMAHRGDHPDSDLAVPHALGVRAELCRVGAPTRHETILHAAASGHPPMVRSALAGGARAARLSRDPATPHARVLWRVGANVAGPLLAGFVLWVLREARRAGLPRLHFVARDGQVLLRIAERLLPALGWDLDCRYLLGSRQAWNLPAMAEVDETALSWLLKEAWREPLAAVLARGELDAGRIAPALARCGLQAMDRPADMAALRALFREPEVIAALQASAAARREAALGYLSEAGLLEPAPLGIVDLGWHGTMQRALRRLLDLGGHAAPLTGFYLALRSQPEGMPPTALRAFLDAPGIVHRLNPVLLEAFCAADHGTVRRYLRQPDGSHGAELAPPDDAAMAWGVPMLQAGILAFAEELAAALRRSRGHDVDHWIVALRDAGLATYDDFRRLPTAEEAEAFGRFPHASGQAHLVQADTAPRISPVQRLRLGLGLRDAAYEGHWPEASVRRDGGRLADTLFLLKRVMRRDGG
jgi:FMN phosphatase YigB (HAD superfamily)